ncbi:hypothetical protein [Homoserinibacter sp. GY 40078]|uniref:hypothetical protein n=1 Tax=Homoserinibacter sp. GY 40078 TaxID=2603275 RepID=UPI0011CA2B90|nr:hypothetical protein [Homoserinibacter sp. GY 40078]TXK18811.1 hypothetical protein FVQ89_02390 [Homoserinibacter sp. GY 40078]
MTDPVDPAVPPVPPAPPAPPQPAAAPDTYPGKGLGIAGLILAIFLPLIGLILSIVARSQSKNAGYKNTPATVGIVIGIVLIVIGIIVSIIIGVASAAIISTTDLNY